MKVKTLPSVNANVSLPSSNEIQEMLPAVADFVEFLFNFSCFSLMTGLGQALSKPMQMLLILLCNCDLLLVILQYNSKQSGN